MPVTNNRIPSVLRTAMPAVLAAFILSSAPAGAATIDLADNAYSDGIAGTAPGSLRSFSESVDGATFMFTATANFVGDAEFVGITSPGLGLRLGGGGNSTIQFTVLSDTDVRFDRYSTVSIGDILVSPGPFFTISGGTVASSDNALPQNVAVNLFDSAPVELAANTLYTFDIGNTGFLQTGFISSIEFTTLVPLPAPLLLFASGLLGVMTLRRAPA